LVWDPGLPGFGQPGPGARATAGANWGRGQMRVENSFSIILRRGGDLGVKFKPCQAGKRLKLPGLPRSGGHSRARLLLGKKSAPDNPCGKHRRLEFRAFRASAPKTKIRAVVGKGPHFETRVLGDIPSPTPSPKQNRPRNEVRTDYSFFNPYEMVRARGTGNDPWNPPRGRSRGTRKKPESPRLDLVQTGWFLRGSQKTRWLSDGEEQFPARASFADDRGVLGPHEKANNYAIQEGQSMLRDPERLRPRFRKPGNTWG